MNLGRRRDSHYVPPSPFREDREPEPEPEPDPEPPRVWKCRVNVRGDLKYELAWESQEDRDAFVDWLVAAGPETTWYRAPNCGFRVPDVVGYYLSDYARHLE